jgi:RNA polymerase sigma factor (sigma-70 family)
MVLARKAEGLRPSASLAAWLLVTTRFTALDALHARARRERHEREAAEMAKTETPPIDPAQWDTISPHLDAALASLNGRDREAITLRYFQDKTFKEVADAMGMSVGAARQRVHRATARMRVFFAKRGAPVALAAIGPMILASAVHAAPAGLAAISAAAATPAAGTAAAGATGSALTGKGMVLLMALTKAKVALGMAVLAVVCGGGALVAYKASAPPRETVVVIPPTPASANAPSGDWEARLNQAYALAEGQDVKQIPTPFVAERDQLWAKQVKGFKVPANVIITFAWNGSKLECRNFVPEPGTLFTPLTLGAGLRPWEMDESVPGGMKLPGDWVFRRGAPAKKVMEGLASIVSAKLGREVRFERRRVIRESVVVRGTYHSVPLPGHPNDGVIEMHPAAYLGPAQNESLRQFLEGLDKYAYRKVFVEIESPTQQPVKVREGLWGGKVDQQAILRNFAAQTSLRFDREPREVEMWFMTDASGATQPTAK